MGGWVGDWMGKDMDGYSFADCMVLLQLNAFKQLTPSLPHLARDPITPIQDYLLVRMLYQSVVRCSVSTYIVNCY